MVGHLAKRKHEMLSKRRESEPVSWCYSNFNLGGIQIVVITTDATSPLSTPWYSKRVNLKPFSYLIEEIQ